jgi:glycosyltransferase involved in cell wall biosynthesis
MRLDQITPVILTFNEEPNIARVLDCLRWAQDIVVVDSGSTDSTVELVRQFRNVRLFVRPFDSHERQWSYAVNDTDIATNWVLTFDADYIISEEGIEELRRLEPGVDIAGYEASFLYCIHGHPLRHSLYPPRIVLFRRGKGVFHQDGHTQRVTVAGSIEPLRQPLRLDDWKPISHWVVAQDRYARLERNKLLGTFNERLSLPDRLRKRRYVAPILVLLYCLIVKRQWRDGLAGWHYTYQRVLAEILLSLYLIEDRIAAENPRLSAGVLAPPSEDIV